MLDIVFLLLGLVMSWRVFNASRFPEAGFLLVFSYAVYVYMGGVLMGLDDFYSTSPDYPQLMSMIRWGYFSIILAFLLVSRLPLVVTPDFKGTFSLRQTEWSAVSLLALCSLVAAVTFLIIMPGNPLEAMLTNSEQFAFEREAVTTGMRSFGFFSNIFYDFMPIIWLSFYFHGKYKTAYFLFSANLFVLLATGQKSPLVFSFLYLTLAIGLKQGKFNYGKSVLASMLVFCVLIGVVMLQNWHLLIELNENTIFLALSALEHRTFMVGAIVLLNYLETFPVAHAFLIAQASAVPPDQIVYINTYGSGIAGSVNAVSLGNFYARFGEISIAAALMFCVAIVFYFGAWVIRSVVRISPLSQAFYIVYCVIGVKLVVTDWYTVLPIFWLSLFVIFGFVYAYQMAHNARHNGRAVAHGGYWFVLFSLIALCYFVQGQLRSLLAA